MRACCPVRISSARIEALLRDAERSLATVNALEALKNGPVRATLEGARRMAQAFFAVLAAGALPGDAKRLLSEVPAEVLAAHRDLDLRLAALEAVAKSRREESLQVIARRTTELRGDLRA